MSTLIPPFQRPNYLSVWQNCKKQIILLGSWFLWTHISSCFVSSRVRPKNDSDWTISCCFERWKLSWHCRQFVFSLADMTLSLSLVFWCVQHFVEFVFILFHLHLEYGMRAPQQNVKHIPIGWVYPLRMLTVALFASRCFRFAFSTVFSTRLPVLKNWGLYTHTVYCAAHSSVHISTSWRCSIFSKMFTHWINIAEKYYLETFCSNGASITERVGTNSKQSNWGGNELLKQNAECTVNQLHCHSGHTVIGLGTYKRDCIGEVWDTRKIQKGSLFDQFLDLHSGPEVWWLCHWAVQGALQLSVLPAGR